MLYLFLTAMCIIYILYSRSSALRGLTVSVGVQQVMALGSSGREATVRLMS